MIDISPAVAKLQSDWHTLHDLDRARAVNAINRAGASVRELAKALNCSPSLLRHLLGALQAPPEDRYLAHQGKISTNELVRRAQAAAIDRETSKRTALERERCQASQKGCKAISDWLAAEGIAGPTGAQVVGEARTTLAIAEHNNTLPRDAAPPGMQVSEIIQRCRPAEPTTDEASYRL